MGSLARSVCVSPLFLSDLRRAVLNPTDLYSLPFVNKSGHWDKQFGSTVVCGHLAPYSTELPSDEGAAEMNKVRTAPEYSMR